MAVAMADKIETIHGSVIQHGRHNDRIYLMHLYESETASLIATLDRMAVEHGYGKIIAKIPVTAWHGFKAAGYIQEALVPGFFNGETDGLFIAKFYAQDRQQPTGEAGGGHGNDVPAETTQTAMPAPALAVCTPVDAASMARIYARVFETYAFPIHRPDYIRQMMATATVYCCARIDRQIVALAAAEIDPVHRASEMTDFATLPEYRGRGLAQRLLHRLDREAVKRYVKTAYTIARADSGGMNRVFEKLRLRLYGCS
jgi:beta-lysine N6-acetyltransferase